MKIGIPIVHTSVKTFRLIHKNFTVLAKVQKSKEKERKEKKKTVQTKSIGKSPFRSVPIRRINILEKRDSIPGIGSNRFFSCFFKVTATFQRDRPSLLDPIRFSTPYIYIYIHIWFIWMLSRFFLESNYSACREIGGREKNALYVSITPRMENEIVERVSDRRYRDRKWNVWPVTPCDLNLRFRSNRFILPADDAFVPCFETIRKILSAQ